eukprot:1430569-Alexandrium_andersonii.AAC.1
MRRQYKELRAISVIPWAGPKAILDEVEFASLEPDGLLSRVFVVAASEDDHFNCLEAVPECMLDEYSRRWRLSCFADTRRRAVLGNSDGTAPWGSPHPAGR